MTRRELHLVVPGSLEQPTGGYIYDRRMRDGLVAAGWEVPVYCLEGRFPGPDPRAEAGLERLFQNLPDRCRVVVDGLALGAQPTPAERHGRRLRLIALVHHPLYLETGLSARLEAELEALEQRALQSGCGIIATSPCTAERLRDWLPPGVPIRAVMPGTDPVARAADPVPGEPPLLLSVGSLVPRKGQDLLIRALGRLKDYSWRCLLAGSDTRDARFAERLRAEILRQGLDARVQILGECTAESLQQLYHRASLFVLPSWHEGFGMAFTEAMAHGLPVVATTGGAIPRTVPTTAALLSEPGDLDGLTRSLSRLLADPELRASLARGAWDHSRTLPSWEEAAACFATAIDELAGP